MGQLQRWWREKYKLPTTHDLFQTQSVPELLLEWYEDLYVEYDELTDLVGEMDGNLGPAMRRLEQIQGALGLSDGVLTGDPLVDYWEAQIRRGEVPDLDMKLEDVPRG